MSPWIARIKDEHTSGRTTLLEVRKWAARVCLRSAEVLSRESVEAWLAAEATSFATAEAQRVDGSGPPADWLKRVRAQAPELLRSPSAGGTRYFRRESVNAFRSEPETSAPVSRSAHHEALVPEADAATLNLSHGRTAGMEQPQIEVFAKAPRIIGKTHIPAELRGSHALKQVHLERRSEPVPVSANAGSRATGLEDVDTQPRPEPSSENVTAQKISMRTSEVRPVEVKTLYSQTDVHTTTTEAVSQVSSGAGRHIVSADTANKDELKTHSKPQNVVAVGGERVRTYRLPWQRPTQQSTPPITQRSVVYNTAGREVPASGSASVQSIQVADGDDLQAFHMRPPEAPNPLVSTWPSLYVERHEQAVQSRSARATSRAVSESTYGASSGVFNGGASDNSLTPPMNAAVAHMQAVVSPWPEITGKWPALPEDYEEDGLSVSAGVHETSWAHVETEQRGLN